MERSQKWPDLRSPISKFWDIHFIDTVACSNRWKFQGNRSVGVALTKIQTFYEMTSLDVTWWPNLAWPGSEIFTICVEMMYDKVCQKRWRCAPPFLDNMEKTGGGGLNNPPSRAKVNDQILYFSWKFTFNDLNRVETVLWIHIHQILTWKQWFSMPILLFSLSLPAPKWPQLKIIDAGCLLFKVFNEKKKQVYRYTETSEKAHTSQH